MKILILSDAPFFPSPFKKYYLDKITSLTNHSIMKQVLFNTAVFLAVNQLRQSGSFSVYDVTKKLRDDVNAGQLEFTDRDVEDVDGVTTYRVKHEDVKIVFNDFFSNDAFPSLSKQYNGSYYVFSDSTSTPSLPGPVTRVNPTLSPFYKAAVTQRPVSKDPIAQQVVDYLKGRAGTSTTMKQIQSRFKGTSKTCAQYAGMLISLGYVVQNANLPFSKQTV